MKASDEPVVVEQLFNTAVDNVWNAITKHDLMLQWYFDNIPSFEAEVGFETQFNVHNEGRDFLHMWKVTEVVPGKKITYTWKFDGYPGDGYVTWELFEDDGSTKLILTLVVTEDYPDDIPEFKRESCVGGWDYFIRGRLKEFLEKPV